MDCICGKQISQMAPRACYRTLNLFGGQIKIPIAYYIRSEENKDTKTHFGFEGNSLKQIYVLPKTIKDKEKEMKKKRETEEKKETETETETEIKIKKEENKENEERIETILSVDDIEKVIERGEIVKHIENENGDLVPITSIPGLEALMNEHTEKKKEVDIEVLGIFDISELPFDRFNGRQYYTTSEKAGKKQPNSKDTQLYQCLIEYLKENKKYIHIRYYWNCSTAQEISAMYVKNDSLVISGMFPDFSLREIPKYNQVNLDNDLQNKLQEKLNKYYINEKISIEDTKEIKIAEVLSEPKTEIQEEPPEAIKVQKNVFVFDKQKLYTLDWFDYYYESFTSKNVKKKKEISHNKLSENNKEDILSILDEI